MSYPEKDKLLQRLNRIEGQVRGLQRLITEDESCNEILTQIAAVRAALAQVGKVIFEEHSRVCIKQALSEPDGGEETLQNLLKALNRLLK